MFASDQVTYRCRLSEVANLIENEGQVRPPAIVIVGDVADIPQELSWFERRPLFGQTIMVTRPEQQQAELADQLSELGAGIVRQPAIKIVPSHELTSVDRAITQLNDFDWLVFSSANGVRFLLDRVIDLGCDMRQLGCTKIAAIGPGTADALTRYHLRADLVPKTSFRAETLADDLKPLANGRRFLLARASRGREILAEQLCESGANVEQVVVYESTDVPEAEAEVRQQLEAGRIDWITVTSSAIARSLAQMFGDSLRHAKIASISPITTATLHELGHEVAAEASEYTMPGLVAAIAR